MNNLYSLCESYCDESFLYSVPVGTPAGYVLQFMCHENINAVAVTLCGKSIGIITEKGLLKKGYITNRGDAG